MIAEELQHVVVEHGQIARHDDFDIALLFLRALSRFCDDVANALEMQQRLTALNLDLQSARRRSEREIERTARGLLAHVIAFAIGADARHLAVVTRMLAAQRDDEDVQTRESVE